MISTVLATNPDFVRLLFWALLATGAVMGWILHRIRARRALTALTVISLLGPLALTLSPSTAQPEAFCYVGFSIPFQGTETLANMTMLLPLALFATLRFGGALLVLTAVSVLSALTELTQALLPVLGRTCVTDDWFMNTLGAALGASIAAGIIVLNKQQPQTTNDHPPQKQLH